MPEQAVQTIGAGDFPAIRKRILDNSLVAVQSRFPIENEQYTLSLENVGYQSIPDYTRADQKRALQTDSSLSARLRGRWVLTDKATGKVVSKSNLKGIMDVPWLTERGTFIRRGSEVTLPIQMRLVPGVYARLGEDGKAKAHINARQGTGNSVIMTMDPANPVFKLTVGTRNYKLYPLLKHLGTQDEDLMKMWGEDIYRSNYDDFVKGGGWYSKKQADDLIAEAMEELAPGETEQQVEEEAAIPAPVDGETEDPYDKIVKDVLGGQLDPLNTKATFGREFPVVDADLLRETSLRLLKVTRGELPPDNRDSLENQRFYAAPELIGERVRLDAGGLARNLLWKASRNGNVDKIPGGALTKYIGGLFTESNLAQVIEETNPLDAYARATKVTRMGEGGISSIDSAPMSARMVHNTYKGFIDPVSSPECCSNKHLVFTKLGWKPIAEVTVEDLVACLIDGRLEYHRPEQTVSYTFSGDLCCYSSQAVGYEVTENHRMWTCRHPRKARLHIDGRWRNAYAPEYSFEYAGDMHNTERRLQVGGHSPLLHGELSSITLVSSEDVLTFSMDDWCEFLGWYVSEGSFLHTDPYKRAVFISQTRSANPENHAQIHALLKRMKLKYGFNAYGFRIVSRALYTEVSKLGYCDDKYVPETVFMANDEARRMFVDAILKGDGRKRKGADGSYKMSVLCTTSKRLAADFERLLFELGYAVSVKYEKDDRQERYLGCYTVRCLEAAEAWLWKNGHGRNRQKKEGTTYFSKKPYRGLVYCLSVKGGLFYTKIEGKHPFWIGNSLRVGLDTQIAIGAQLGSDGLAYTPMLDTNGKRVMVSSVEAAAVPIAFPEYRNSTDRVIPAMLGDRIEYVPKSQVKYFLPNGDSLFAMSSSLIPLKGGIKAGRLLMAQKHQTQAMPLPNRMAPYVQTLDPDGSGRSVEDRYSDILGSVRAPLGGTVISVTPDEVMVKPPEGPPVRHSLYNHHPLNRKTMVHNTPRVKPGDVLKPGQLIASSNYTDEKGTAALGTQLVTAWLAFKGHNYLDGIVISESAAKKLASEHLYRTAIDRDKETDYSRDAYVGAFPTKFNRDQIATLDSTGVVKKGVVLKKGDPMVLGLARRAPGPDTMFRPLAKDASEVWEHEFPGTVVDVVNDDRGIKVYAQAEVPAAVGDKLAARFANKGTIGLILPDSRMPRTQDGTAIDVAFSPTGIPSRVNSGAIVEAALGKVAAKTGKGYVLPGFMDESMAVFAKRELAKNGLTDREDLVDPDSGNTIPKIMVGNSYITKFHHTSESKGGARSTGGYTSDELPSMGGDNGAKSLGGLVLGAVVAHGSTGILQDLKTIKGQKNTDFWRDFKMGRTPAMPGTPLIYERFLAHLEGSGVHVNREGLDTNIFALTDRDVKQYARTALDNAQTYDSATMRPLKGGLFDPAIFGPEGNQWGRIDLDEPIPNPVMEDVIRGLLGLRAADLDSVLAGQRKLSNGLTGGAGLTAQLKSIDVDQAIKDNRNTILHGSSSKRNQAVKNYRWLSAMKQHGATPANFMLTSVPVLPPRFRRVSRSDGMDMIADANYLYKALMDAREDARMAAKSGLPDDMVGMGRLAVYNAFKAVTGLSEPADKQLQDKDINGLLTWVFGKGSPKCHDDNTDLLTEQGFVPIKDYDGSYPCAYAVPGKDGEQSLQFSLPGKVIHARHVGEMIRITGEGMDALVTPNHRCYISYRQTAAIGQYQMVEARHLLEAGVPFYIRSAPEDAESSIPQLVRPENLSLEKFDGMIHAVTVPTGITIVRRNGMISLTGNSGKFQRSVVGGNLDVAGRSVINADPELRMDQVGLPINQAWDLYRDFIIRRLVQNGATVLQATKEVVERNKRAEEVLQQVIKERPLILTRAPALHKYSVMAFWPQLVEGDTLKLNSVIQEPFNADNDGDQQIGRVKVLIQPELLFSDGNKALECGDGSLCNFERMLHYLLGRESILNNEGASAMQNKNTAVLMKIKGEDKAIVTEVDLEDFPHGRLIAAGVGADKNIDMYAAFPGLMVQAYDENRDEFVWAEVKYWTKHTGREVEIVRLTSGDEIHTDNDPRAVYGIPTDGEGLAFDRFTPSEALARKVMVPITASSDDVQEEVPAWTTLETGTLYRQKPTVGTAIPLDFETGQFLGVMVGDGWWDKKDHPGFKSFGGDGRAIYLADLEGYCDKSIRSVLGKYVDPDFQAVCKEYRRDDYKDRYGDTVRYSYYFFGGQAMCKFLDDSLGGARTEESAGSASKHLPHWLWSCSSEFRRGVLCGLIATDGTICVGNTKDKPQLIVAFSSTSLRLCQEIRRLCRSLGIGASVGYSKETIRGNSSWVVYLSTPDCKMVNAFAGLCHERKRVIFDTTEVSSERQHTRGRWVVYPRAVSDAVARWVKRPNIESSARSVESPKLERLRYLQSLFSSLYAAKPKGYVTESLAEALMDRAAEMDAERERALHVLTKWLGMVTERPDTGLDKDLIAEFTAALDIYKDQLPSEIYRKTRALFSRRASLGKACVNMSTQLAEVLRQPLKVAYGLSQEPLFIAWCSLAKANCRWGMVESVDKTGKVEVGYDLCVPGYETFVSADGVVLSNTMTYYVPVTDRAVRDATEKMLPSKNLLSARNFTAHYLPQEEIVLGSYLASRPGKGPVRRTFETRKEAVAAWRRGEIDLNDNIQITGE